MDNLPRLLLYPLYTQSQTKTNHTMEFKKIKIHQCLWDQWWLILLMTLLKEQVPGNFLQNLLVIYKYWHPPPILKHSHKISCRSVGLCISKVGRTTDLHFHPWKKRCLFIVCVFITYIFNLIYHIFLLIELKTRPCSIFLWPASYTPAAMLYKNLFLFKRTRHPKYPRILGRGFSFSFSFPTSQLHQLRLQVISLDRNLLQRLPLPAKK